MDEKIKWGFMICLTSLVCKFGRAFYESLHANKFGIPYLKSPLQFNQEPQVLILPKESPSQP